MTLAEQIMQSRLNKKDAPTLSSSHNSMPNSLETWQHSVESESLRLEQQQKDLVAQHNRIAVEQEEVNQLRANIDQANHFPQKAIPVQVACDVGEGKAVKGEQKCVTPIRAMKNFFINWTIKGRASRSEVWWIILLFEFPLRFLGRAVGQSDLTILLGIISLILLWPSFCLEGRRFHDLGCNAAFGIGLGLIQTTIIVIHEVTGEGSICPLVELVIGFVFFLVNISPSQPCANQYGERPNLNTAQTCRT